MEINILSWVLAFLDLSAASDTSDHSSSKHTVPFSEPYTEGYLLTQGDPSQLPSS